MKTTMKITGMILILLTAGSMVLSAQNGRGRANSGNYCTNLPDLTEKQKTELTALSGKHQSEMDALRSEMRSTTDTNKKTEVLAKMDNIRDTHRTEVQSLLTDKQKDAFNAGCMAGKGGMNARSGMGGKGCGNCGRNGSGARNGRS